MAQPNGENRHAHPSRRQFLKTSAAAASAAWWVTGQAYGQGESKSANEQLNFACIGVGGKGASDSNNASKCGKIVAMCDIDKRQLKRKERQPGFKEAKQFADSREMLDSLGDKIDAVTVSTPDHCHALNAADALRTGKHVYCQKPLTWSIDEARYLGELFDKVKKDGVCTQMGNQGTSKGGFREGVEFLRSGALGDVTEVHVWTNRPIWPQGEGRPEGSDPVPPFLSWNLWLGPAPKRPFVGGVYHPFNWRGWLDFGTGALGDMACHTANLPVMGLSLFDPVHVEAESSGIVEGETYPKSSRITFHIPERKGHDGKTLAACKFYWYDGGKKPDSGLLMGVPMKDSGMVAVGSEGRLYSKNDYGSEWITLPKEKEFPKPKNPSVPAAPESYNGAGAHFSEFAKACRTRKPELAESNFDYATRLTETILWGNVALRAGGPVEIKNGEITSPSGGNKYLGRDYRQGWTLRG